MNKTSRLVQALGPLVRGMASGYGWQVAQTTAIATTGTGNRTVYTYAATPTRQVPGFLADAQAIRKARGWGLGGESQLVLVIPRQASGLIPVAMKDRFAFIDGPYEGRTYLAETEGAPDPVGSSVFVALVSA